MRVGSDRRPKPRQHFHGLLPVQVNMPLGRTDVPVYPTPRIGSFSAFKMAVAMLGAVIMVVVVIMVMPMAFDVNAAVKVAVGLVHHRRTDRSLGVGERDRERASALDDLGQPAC